MGILDTFKGWFNKAANFLSPYWESAKNYIMPKAGDFIKDLLNGNKPADGGGKSTNAGDISGQIQGHATDAANKVIDAAGRVIAPWIQEGSAWIG